MYDYGMKDDLYSNYYAWQELCDYINKRFNLVPGNGGLDISMAMGIWGLLTDRRSHWENASDSDRRGKLQSLNINRVQFRKEQGLQQLHEREAHLYLEHKMGREPQPPTLSQRRQLEDLQQRYYQRLQEQQQEE